MTNVYVITENEVEYIDNREINKQKVFYPKILKTKIYKIFDEKEKAVKYLKETYKNRGSQMRFENNKICITRECYIKQIMIDTVIYLMETIELE